MNLVKTKSFELALYTKGDPDSAKLAIVTPGRLDCKDYAHNTSLVDFLAAKGFFALSFDPPGTWESPGEISLYTTTNYIKAVNELIEYFGNKPTLLAGHSRGGTVAMLVGSRNPLVSSFIAILSSTGAPDAPDESRVVNGALISYRDVPPGTSKTEEHVRFDLPLHYFADGQQYDARGGLSSCTKPKLFFYSTKDDANELEKVGYGSSPEPKMIHALETEHDYRYHTEVLEEVNQVVGQFIDTYSL
jgi:pimeloyl-ACP methyl ester carboxylesterase